MPVTEAVARLQEIVRDWTEKARTAERRAGEQAILIQQQATELQTLKTQLGISTVQKGWTDAVEEYLAWGDSPAATRGRAWSAGHLHQQTVRLRWWGEQLHQPQLADISLSLVETAMQGIADLSPKTRHDFVASLKSFLSWCRKHNYLATDPLVGLSSIEFQPTEDWRALTEVETQRLLQKCNTNHRLLYEVALCTGFRINEIRSLRVKNLDVTGSCLRPDAATVKNRKRIRQPIPRGLADRLAFHVRDKDPDDLLIFVARHYTVNFIVDLRRASIPRQTPEGLAVFHSLRKTYTTLLQQTSGASLVEAQKLTRHSDPRMTANTYTRSSDERLQSLVDDLGARILA